MALGRGVEEKVVRAVGGVRIRGEWERVGDTARKRR